MSEVGNKRSRDAAQLVTAGVEPDTDASKKQKQVPGPTEQEKEAEELTRQDEEQQPGQMEEVNAGDAAYGAGNDGAAEEAGPLQGGDTAGNGHAEQDKQDADEPRKIGYKVFPNGQAAYKYYKMLLRELTHNQDLNEYEHHMVVDLLKQGHPSADQKDGGCLRAVQVREHATEQSVCFHLMRSDAIVEDFSLNKCLTTLFPTWAQSRAAKQEEASDGAKHSGPGRGHGRGRGRGRRGGRGRGRRGRH